MDAAAALLQLPQEPSFPPAEQPKPLTPTVGCTETEGQRRRRPRGADSPPAGQSQEHQRSRHPLPPLPPAARQPRRPGQQQQQDQEVLGWEPAAKRCKQGEDQSGLTKPAPAPAPAPEPLQQPPAAAQTWQAAMLMAAMASAASACQQQLPPESLPLPQLPQLPPPLPLPLTPASQGASGGQSGNGTAVQQPSAPSWSLPAVSAAAAQPLPASLTQAAAPAGHAANAGALQLLSLLRLLSGQAVQRGILPQSPATPHNSLADRAAAQSVAPVSPQPAIGAALPGSSTSLPALLPPLPLQQQCKPPPASSSTPPALHSLSFLGVPQMPTGPPAAVAASPTALPPLPTSMENSAAQPPSASERQKCFEGAVGEAILRLQYLQHLMAKQEARGATHEYQLNVLKPWAEASLGSTADRLVLRVKGCIKLMQQQWREPVRVMQAAVGEASQMLKAQREELDRLKRLEEGLVRHLQEARPPAPGQPPHLPDAQPPPLLDQLRALQAADEQQGQQMADLSQLCETVAAQVGELALENASLRQQMKKLTDKQDEQQKQVEQLAAELADDRQRRQQCQQQREVVAALQCEMEGGGQGSRGQLAADEGVLGAERRKGGGLM
ncbi:hypothetical protein D9Q98_006390 [Chlorella vulgaris]|uniref:Uncharacterized protein n=1 Tax=Chlorella vulgaris TaxID=3077 RepID=A0A9D4TK51_CHLVU|nr:hypothetical protein D9Q98_006390 [Chlorella vulgaris]